MAVNSNLKFESVMELSLVLGFKWFLREMASFKFKICFWGEFYFFFVCSTGFLPACDWMTGYFATGYFGGKILKTTNLNLT